jgi:hypothetical protein
VDADASTPAALDDAQAHERRLVRAFKSRGEGDGFAWVECEEAGVQDERGDGGHEVLRTL